jgi:hypothetical protein
LEYNLEWRAVDACTPEADFPITAVNSITNLLPDKTTKKPAIRNGGLLISTVCFLPRRLHHKAKPVSRRIERDFLAQGRTEAAVTVLRNILWFFELRIPDTG